MVWYHHISSGQPLSSGRLGCQPRPGIILGHSPFDRLVQPHFVPAVDDDGPPIGQSVTYQGHLDHHWILDFLHPGIDPAEDMRVCNGLQVSQLPWIVEHDPGQSASVDFAAIDDLRPSFHDLFERRAIGTEDFVTDAVGVDGVETVSFEKLSHLGLPRGETAAEDPTMLLRTHEAGR